MKNGPFTGLAYALVPSLVVWAIVALIVWQVI